MENELELHWSGTGTLRIANRGLVAIALRYMPDLSVVAKNSPNTAQTPLRILADSVNKVPIRNRKHPPRGGKSILRQLQLYNSKKKRYNHKGRFLVLGSRLSAMEERL